MWILLHFCLLIVQVYLLDLSEEQLLPIIKAYLDAFWEILYFTVPHGADPKQ